MNNILLKYMVERFNAEGGSQKNQQKNLPFITISREYGCPADEVAKMIIHKLNLVIKQNKNTRSWTTLSKEILQAAAEELNIEPARIDEVFNDEKRGVIDDMLISLSKKYYYSDRKILKTIDKVILDFAMQGNVVILGRGGMAVTRDLPTGLHIRLFAPMGWRIKKLLDSGVCKTIEEAKTISKKMDIDRNELLKNKSKSENFEDDFDIFYNCKYLNIEEIANSVIHFLLIKMLI